MNRPLDLVVIGCGARGIHYASLAISRWPERYRVTAAADPRPERAERVRALGGEGARAFASADACFAAGRLGDVAVVATQDHDHVGPCLRALALGYDVLLEKPVAPTPAEVLRVRAAAARAGRRVVVCHVLRYAPLWSRVAGIIAAGRLGQVIHIDHREGVGAWHQVHSFVRGHWARSASATPMILAKCCHDLDLLRWFVGRTPLRIASMGALTHFAPARRPAGAADRCAGCAIRATCAYDCAHYADRHRGWLGVIDPDLAEHGTRERILAAVEASPWGRCAWACDNDAVDHQSVLIDWGDATASLTMTAFDEGRRMAVLGSEGRLIADDADGGTIELIGHHGGRERIAIAAEHDGHGGADAGLVGSLAEELRCPPEAMLTGIGTSVDSHLMAFAAEASRRAGGGAVDLAAFAAASQP